MDTISQERIDRAIQFIIQRIDSEIINTQGKAGSFQYDSYLSYKKTTKYRSFGSPKEELSGDGVVLSNAIKSALPFGVSVSEEYIQRNSFSFDSTTTVDGDMKIVININEEYAEKRFEALHKTWLPIMSGIKQHKDVLEKLVSYVGAMNENQLRNHSACIYPHGIFKWDGDCQGGGISFSSLGMSSLNMDGRLALANVIVNSLNDKENKYYIETKVYDWLYGIEFYIYIMMKPADEPTPQLESWC